MAYSEDPHGDRTRRVCVLPLGEASHDAGTASVAVVAPTSAKRRTTMWMCSCHACDRTKLNEAGALEKSGKVNELFRAQLKARRMSEHPLTDAIRTLRGS